MSESDGRIIRRHRRRSDDGKGVRRLVAGRRFRAPTGVDPREAEQRFLRIEALWRDNEEFCRTIGCPLEWTGIANWAAERLRKPTAAAESPVTISLVFNVRGGDVIHHETVVHSHEVPVPRAEERLAIPRRIESVPRHPVDPQCERLRKEHEERIRRWRATPLRQ
jgi:hypothetical protein